MPKLFSDVARRANRAVNGKPKTGLFLEARDERGRRVPARAARAAGCARREPPPPAPAQDPRAQGEEAGGLGGHQPGRAEHARHLPARGRGEFPARSPRCVSRARVQSRGGAARRRARRPARRGRRQSPRRRRRWHRGGRARGNAASARNGLCWATSVRRVSRRPILLAVQRERLEKKSVFFSPASICGFVRATLAEHRLTHFTLYVPLRLDPNP